MLEQPAALSNLPPHTLKSFLRAPDSHGGEAIFNKIQLLPSIWESLQCEKTPVLYFNLR
jgi:hypothetical protein